MIDSNSLSASPIQFLNWLWPVISSYNKHTQRHYADSIIIIIEVKVK